MNKHLLALIDSLKDLEWIEALTKLFNVYLVGGCVRDGYLGRDSKDIDLVLEGSFNFSDIIKTLKPFGTSDVVGESFSVIKFKDKNTDIVYDLALARTDRKIGIGHKGFEINNKNVSIKEDLNRRDFTMNAIAINILTQEVIDPHNGLESIATKTIHMIHSHNFIEDPLRMLRAIQFASRFEFSIDDITLKEIRHSAHLIKEIPPERILIEIDKAAHKGNRRVFFHYFLASGLASEIYGRSPIIYLGELSDLDVVGFYYVLAKFGKKSPADFYINKLKGNSAMYQKLKCLEIMISDQYLPSDELKVIAFNIYNKIGFLDGCIIVPPVFKNIFYLMQCGDLPKCEQDILIDGNDIMNLGVSEGLMVGMLKKSMIYGALDGRYNWRSKEDTIKYLNSLI